MVENMVHPHRSKFSIWLQATRPFAFSASVIPVLAAAMAALYYHPGHIDWILLPVIIIGAVLFHTGGNLVSEYFDYQKAVDRYDTFGSSRVLVDGLLKPKEVLTAGYICFSVGFLLGLILVYYRGLDIFYLGLFGLIGGIFYTAGPIKFKYIALGDILIFLSFGPILMLGSYLGLTGVINPKVFWISIPIAFLVVGILHANNVRDIKHDKRASIRTVASISGIAIAKIQYYFLVIGAYVATIILILTGYLEWWSLIVIVSLPPALGNLKQMSKANTENPQDIATLDVQTAQHHMMFGLLYTISILLAVLL